MLGMDTTVYNFIQMTSNNLHHPMGTYWYLVAPLTFPTWLIFGNLSSQEYAPQKLHRMIPLTPRFRHLQLLL